MVYHCYECQAVSHDAASLCDHYKYVHRYTALSSYHCIENNCGHEFQSVYVFKKHLVKQHPIHHENHNIFNEWANENIVNEEEILDPLNGVNQQGNAVIEDVQDHLALTLAEFRELVFKSSLAFVANLYASPSLCRAHVQEVVETTTEFLASGFLDHLQKKTFDILRHFNDFHDEQELNELSNYFDVCKNVFCGLESEHQRFSELHNSGAYTHPESYTIGVGEVMRNVDGNPVLTPIEIQGQFISMKRTLKLFFELPGTLDATLQNMQNLSESDSFTNIVQSPLWRNIKANHFNDKNVLPLIVYFDEAEPDNQTGSHSGDNSLGLVYYNIPCIPQYQVSSLDNIFVASIFASHCKSFGNEALFRPVIKDLLELEQNGLQITTSNGTVLIYFAVCLIAGDNLGLHSITGFVESFSANYFCRICKDHRETTYYQYRENVALLRTVENYNEDLGLNDVSQTGIKEDCVWNSLNSFHVVVNLYVEICHDLFEGVCHYDLCALLDVLIFQLKFFTLETLNDRVQNFQYGPTEVCNKPTFITVDHIRNGKLKMSASEMLCFVRHLGLIIGDLVPEGNEEWQLYVILCKIVDIVTAPFVDENSASYLSTLVAEHHHVYCTVFSKKLKPKYHLMVHYARVMLLLGPLMHVWVLRFEGKHRPVVKQVAKATNCRKNLPLTVAKKVQLKFSAKLLSCNGFQNAIQYHPRASELANFDNYHEFRHVLPPNYLNAAYSVSEVNIMGTQYKINMVVALNCFNDLPLFSTILAIVKPVQPNTSSVFFLLKNLNTLGYSDHLHAYEVSQTTDFVFVDHANLISYCPSIIRHHARNGNSYVVFRHAL